MKPTQIPLEEEIITESDLQEAMALDAEIKKDPAKLAISEQATKAIQEIEDIFFGSGSYNPNTQTFRTNRIHSNELIHWIKNSGIDPEILQTRILELVPGQTIIISGETFIKTFDSKFMEVQAYVNVLEKTLAKLQLSPQKATKKRKGKRK